MRSIEAQLKSVGSSLEQECCPKCMSLRSLAKVIVKTVRPDLAEQ
jgi:lambda repressor-like predicted transcriptional regulator